MRKIVNTSAIIGYLASKYKVDKKKVEEAIVNQFDFVIKGFNDAIHQEEIPDMRLPFFGLFYTTKFDVDRLRKRYGHPNDKTNIFEMYTEDIKKLRKGLDALLEAIKDYNTEIGDNYKEFLFHDIITDYMLEARMLLGMVLYNITFHDPYLPSKSLRQADNGQGKVIDPPVDTADIQITLPTGDFKAPDFVREALDGALNKSKQIHKEIAASNGDYDPFVYAYLENAIVRLTLARCWIGVEMSMMGEIRNAS